MCGQIDDGNGFIPYDQFMEDFRTRPPPPPPSTFVVHGAGDVIIQDEHGNHIQTYVSSPLSALFDIIHLPTHSIAGRGAEAGRGAPQRYNVNGSTIIVL
jgi:hypothetical protein